MKHLIFTLLFTLYATISYSQDVAGVFDSKKSTMELYFDEWEVQTDTFVPILYNENEAYYCQKTDMYIVPVSNDTWGELVPSLPKSRILFAGESVDRYILTDLIHYVGILIRVDDNYYEVYLL